MSSVSKVKKLECTYMNTEKELKMEKVMDNLIISFSLTEAARVFSVGLCTTDVSSIAMGKLVNGRWRIIWGI